ncbi:hypothetical protein O0L34_g184 [Tuta absoluta]|nr:hypothetical protein O0L34_g184 [Tuta absoluta]
MPTARSSTARSKTAPVPQMLRPRPRPLSPKPLPRSRVAPVSIAPIPKMPTPCPFIAPAPKISSPKQMFSPTRLSPPVTSSRVYILPDELRKEKSPPRSSVHTSPTKRVTFVEPTVIFERW